ncbi:HTH-type transcriptional regulator BhcR [Pelagibius sp.]|uniref:HTH-type transcriptional regulator BhcR n=1 Tax=Pelagibius sp. TaxID=1931238 RepID=UPI0026156517|nr:HTH-type transcriptional regulator BhcR [Pelagibius sp.]
MARAASRTREQTRPAAQKSAGQKPAAQGGQVQSLDRAISILERLAEADGMSLTDLSQSVGLAPSTTHRLLTTLQQRRFADFDEEYGVWVVGVGAFNVGNAFLRSRKIVSLGRPVMRRLMEDVGETINLAVEDKGELVYVTQFESHAPMRAFFRPGRRAPMHSSAIGKAMLAEMGEDALRDFLHRKGMQRFTDRTIVEPAALRAQLQQIRQRGWGVDDEEHTIGMRCVAATIHNEHGEVIAGISISGPSVRVTETRLGELGARVVQAAEEITEQIGGVVPRRLQAAAP